MSLNGWVQTSKAKDCAQERYGRQYRQGGVGGDEFQE